jgi:hypothetical protein
MCFSVPAPADHFPGGWFRIAALGSSAHRLNVEYRFVALSPP